MKKITNKILYILPLAFMYGCEPEFDDVEFNQGSADFSRTVAVGNSLTAGYQNNALRRDKQEVSMPSMIAEQLQQVGGGAFKQPLMDPGVGLGVGSNGTFNAEFGLFLRPDCAGEVGPSPAPISSTGQVDQLSPGSFVGAQGPFNNVGIPGAKSFHLLAPGYGNPLNLAPPTPTANPYYARFSDPTNPNETAVAAAMRANPTFFTLWIGNNDVLSYATSGGSGADQTGNPNAATYGSNDITDPGLFTGTINQIVATLTSGGAKGVIANIPDVTSIPHFTTVPIGTDAINATQATQLNAAYAAYNGGLDLAAAANPAFAPEAAQRKISFTAGQFNAFVVRDPSLSTIPGLPKIRQIKSGELLVLTTPSDSLQCYQLGTAKSIQAKHHLTATEIQNIQRATAAYNDALKNAASANGLAYVDASSTLRKLANGGITINGIQFTDEFVSGGAFSLDGVHPNTRGYAIIANLFIDAINAKYAANVPKVDVSSYPALEISQ